jgi:hypothetical protein
LQPSKDGPSALDVFLNDAACWRNVPEAVWDYTIGGYQVIKKWLSYREKPLLGRGLTSDEVRHVTDTARRLAAIIGLQEELDQAYHKTVESSTGLQKIDRSTPWLEESRQTIDSCRSFGENDR